MGGKHLQIGIPRIGLGREQGGCVGSGEQECSGVEAMIVRTREDSGIASIDRNYIVLPIRQ